MQIHVFSDTSTIAYSATMYVQDEKERTFSVFPKSRIAPIKDMTILWVKPKYLYK